MTRTLLFVITLAGLAACHRPPPCPRDMGARDLAVVDLALPRCAPPGGACDPLKPPPCCDGIACPASGLCLTYDAGTP